MLLQNPFEFAASDAAAEQAAASLPHAPAPDAAATSFDSGDTDCRSDEAAATPRQSDLAAADICDIGEIFVGARKLEQLPGIFDQAGITPADELRYVTLKLMDEPGTRDLPEIPAALWAEFDEPPLFLRAVGH